LRRAPYFLRVTLDEKTFEFDALDLLEDQPRPRESLHCYVLASDPMRCFVRPGGLRVIATYRLNPVQPSDVEMRTTEAWRKWTLENKRPGDFAPPEATP
jgi:hypothetical protein